MRRLFWTVFAACLATARLGFFFTDELGQVLGLTALGMGQVGIPHDLPAGYNTVVGGSFSHHSIPPPGGTGSPVGSMPLNLLALPVLLLLRGAAHAFSPTGAILLLHGLVAAGVAHLWRPTWTAPAFLLPWVGLLLLPALPGSPFLELAAIQVVLSAAVAGAVCLVAATVDTPRATAALALATPLLFWATHAKYHALAALLVVLSWWLVRDGARASPRRWLLAALVVGVAAWDFLPMGGLLLMSLAVVLSPVVRLPARDAWPRLGMGAAGLAIPLTGVALQRWLLARRGLTDQFLPSLRPGGDTDLGRITDSGVPGGDAGWLGHTILQEPGTALRAAWEHLAWTHWMHNGVALSVLCIAPFAVLVLRRHPRLTWGPAARWFPVVYLALALAVMGPLARYPISYDMRYILPVWPFVAAAAAPGVHAAWAWDRRVPRAAATTLAGLTVIGTLGLAVWHRLAGALTPQGYGFDHTALGRYGGLAAGLALLAAHLGLPRWRTALVPVAVAVAAWNQVLAATLWAGTGPADGPFAWWPLEVLRRLAHAAWFPGA